MKDKDGLTGKETAIILHYCTDAKYNGCKAYEMAGYSIRGKGWKLNAMRILHKPYIKAAIDKKMKEMAEKMDVSRENLINKMQNIVDSSKSEGNKIRAASLIGDFCGFKRENAPNAEREASKRAAMDVEERKLAEAVAKVRTREESIKLTKAG